MTTMTEEMTTSEFFSKATTAFMQGKISADEHSELMKKWTEFGERDGNSVGADGNHD